MPGKNFAKLHLKIRIFVHSGSKFLYNAFTRLIRRLKSKNENQALNKVSLF